MYYVLTSKNHSVFKYGYGNSYNCILPGNIFNIIPNKEYFYIRQAIIHNDHKVRKYILGDEKYCIYDIETIKKFNAGKTFDYYYCHVDCAIFNGCVNFLEQLKTYDTSILYSVNRINNLYKLASEYNQINILNWLINSGLSLKYSEHAIDFTSAIGHVDVLEWWKNSGLPLKYSDFSLYYASMYNYINVLEWWLKSGLELKYDNHVLTIASISGNIDVLEWWKNSGLELKYSEDVLTLSSEYLKFDTLNWWIDSGLPLKYSYSFLFDKFWILYYFSYVRAAYKKIKGFLLKS